MRYNILFGGKAGQGPNIIAQLLGEVLTEQGYYTFCSREYASVIRGGHNYNLLTISEKPINSNDTKIDILIALDDKTLEYHKDKLKKEGILLKDSKDNMYYLGKLFKILGLEFDLLEQHIKKLHNFEANLESSKKGYAEEKTILKLKKEKGKAKFISGSNSTAIGSIKSGLDIYYAYPMTPATPLLFELAPKQAENKFITLELENEISVMIATIGSAITGAKAMCGTSGGGFALMTEGLSLAGQAEVPIVVYLAQRPGPATGIPTFTAQADLQFARHAGHGEFPRLIVAPGDAFESQELVSQCFYFSQKYKIPSIFISDKHLSESFYSLEGEPKITKSTKSVSMKRFNSYEHDAEGNVIEDSESVNKTFNARLQKYKDIETESKKFTTYKTYGKSKNIILGWGSTKGAILDAIEGKDYKFIQLLYLEPFPKEILKELKEANKVIVIENNSTSQLSEILAEKTGFIVKDKILKYDGMPFYCNELKEKLQ